MHTHVETEGGTKLSRPNGLSRRLRHYRHCKDGKDDSQGEFRPHRHVECVGTTDPGEELT